MPNGKSRIHVLLLYRVAVGAPPHADRSLPDWLHLKNYAEQYKTHIKYIAAHTSHDDHSLTDWLHLKHYLGE